MKKGITLLLVFGFISLFLKAQVPVEKTLLWQVSGKGIKTPSFLFGTIHLMCEKDIIVQPIVRQKLESAKQLFLELDPDAPGMMMEMIKHIKMKDEVTLQSLMGTQYDTVGKVFQKATGTPMSMLNNFKPIVLVSYIYPTLLGCAPESWEKIFEKIAKTRSMEIFGLENIKDQLAVLDSIPYQEQSDNFAKIVLNLDSAKKEMQKMVEVYNQKDINQLSQLIAADNDLQQYENLLLNNRNQNWIPIIAAAAKKSATFFAFGAGHLGGQNGVIALLRKAGYTVKPLMYP